MNVISHCILAFALLTFPFGAFANDQLTNELWQNIEILTVDQVHGLIFAGAKVDVPVDSVRLAALFATDHVDVLRALLDAGLPANTQMLHIAIGSRNPRMVAAVLEAGAPIDNDTKNLGKENALFGSYKPLI